MTTEPDAPTREDYAAQLVPLAVRLVAAVHDEGPNAVRKALDRARALPAPADGTRVDDALPVILAAMVDPNRSPGKLLGWTRQLDRGSAELLVARPQLNPAAVELALAGRLPRQALNRNEVTEVERILGRRGWTAAQVDAHLDTDPADVREVGAAA